MLPHCALSVSVCPPLDNPSRLGEGVERRADAEQTFRRTDRQTATDEQIKREPRLTSLFISFSAHPFVCVTAVGGLTTGSAAQVQFLQSVCIVQGVGLLQRAPTTPKHESEPTFAFDSNTVPQNCSTLPHLLLWKTHNVSSCPAVFLLIELF